jgi:hypothetical protein
MHAEPTWFYGAPESPGGALDRRCKVAREQVGSDGGRFSFRRSPASASLSRHHRGGWEAQLGVSGDGGPRPTCQHCRRLAQDRQTSCDLRHTTNPNVSKQRLEKSKVYHQGNADAWTPSGSMTARPRSHHGVLLIGSPNRFHNSSHNRKTANAGHCCPIWLTFFCLTRRASLSRNHVCRPMF